VHANLTTKVECRVPIPQSLHMRVTMPMHICSTKFTSTKMSILVPYYNNLLFLELFTEADIIMSASSLFPINSTGKQPLHANHCLKNLYEFAVSCTTLTASITPLSVNSSYSKCITTIVNVRNRTYFIMSVLVIEVHGVTHLTCMNIET